jgi:hypothetical protein
MSKTNKQSEIMQIFTVKLDTDPKKQLEANMRISNFKNEARRGWRG